MKIQQIYTHRNSPVQNYALPIIYEWEDIVSKELNAPTKDFPKISDVARHLHLCTPLYGLYKNTFRFVINGRDYDEFMNSRHIVPCIIDFFETKEQLTEFYNKHSNNKLILVSSPFDCQFLKDNNFPIRVELFAYSLSDKYAITNTPIEKKYDIVLTGRQDPLLYSFFKEYVKKHPNVTYVKRGKELYNDEKKTKEYFVNGRECIGAIESREDFIKLQSQGKVTLYGVQGYHEGFAKGYYHMTPHFLEIIASGCHVLCHYPSGKEGIDAQFYEFDKFSPSIETYEEFEKAMDHALCTEVDINMYASYLKKHYTSVRVTQLQELLNTI